jgi:hypothetical protein
MASPLFGTAPNFKKIRPSQDKNERPCIQFLRWMHERKLEHIRTDPCYSSKGTLGDTTSANGDLHEELMINLKREKFSDATYVPRSARAETTETADTRIEGRFECPNDECDNFGWTSRVVALTVIRYQGGPGICYGTVVYSQRCADCRAVGKLFIHWPTYCARVAWWVLRWADREPGKIRCVAAKGDTAHERELCIGCQRGHCVQGRAGEYEEEEEKEEEEVVEEEDDWW